MTGNKKCIEMVRGSGQFGYLHRHQCNRNAVFGQEYCKQHNPAAVKARQDAAAAKHKQEQDIKTNLQSLFPKNWNAYITRSSWGSLQVSIPGEANIQKLAAILREYEEERGQ